MRHTLNRIIQQATWSVFMTVCWPMLRLAIWGVRVTARMLRRVRHARA
jgi:hypothetical protein